MKEFDLDNTTPLGRFFRSGFADTEGVVTRQVQRFAYTRPALRAGKTRAASRLVNTDILFAIVQLFEEGGETVKHSHAGMDGFWFVLSGTARFYIEDEPPFEVSKGQGLTTPREVKYWFEKAGDEPLEILQVDAIHPGIKNLVTNYGVTEEQRRETQAGLVMYDARSHAEEA